MAEFFCLPISPFSKRAKWALDCSGVPYRQTTWGVSTSYLGELPLRWRLGRMKGRLTAPILIPQGAGPKGAINDSVDIARWADANGRSPGKLFPPEAEATITKLVQDADLVSSFFRRHLAQGALADPAVRRLLLRLLLPPLPPLVTRLLGGLVDRQVKAVMQMMIDKYPEDAAVTEEQARAVLQSISDTLAASSSGCLLPSGLSFADMAWATTLDAMAPGDPFAPSPPPPPAATEGAAEGAAAAANGSGSSSGQGAKAMRFPTMAVPQLRALMEPYAPLVKWKNQVLANHLPKKAQPSPA